jgi:hypothetical protein
MRLDIEFADGHVGATSDRAPSDGATTGATSGVATTAGANANGTRRPVPEGAAADPVRPKSRRGSNPGQGSLF